jgi:hypothetical protein
VREFWQRWHISLSTWLRDYLYIPLGGNRSGGWKVQRNLMLTMLLGGLWHGAAWNFVAWGALHGLYLAAHRVLVRRDRPRGVAPALAPSAWRRVLGRGLGIAFTFHLVLLTWLLFRARPIGDSGALSVAVDYLLRLGDLWTDGWVAPPASFWPLLIVLGLDIMIVRSGTHHWVKDWAWPLRGAVVAALIALGFVLGSGTARAFIYFQF